MSISAELNLARKWRSRQFHEIVGQDLSIRLIKNSLYRNLIFPVYLFAGTRGCGKTSTARLFAAALNCQNLDQFIKDPKFLLPCLDCVSCKAMHQLHHPDFIEVDAASNNGVDNIRQIIESSSFVPSLGRKKIYLIDEAHMLSKAAFNALLKILEEPPDTVVFMLATTDSHKVIDTVKSRCFQLFFNPIETSLLTNHLSAICDSENIVYEKEALEIIAQESEGSARDALNIIERVRLAGSDLTKKNVLEVVGSIDQQILIQLFEAIVRADTTGVLQVINGNSIEKSGALLIYKKWLEFVSWLVLLKHGNIDHVVSQMQNVDLILKKCTVEQLVKLFDISYSYEFSLVKTAHQFIGIELLFIKLAQVFDSTNDLSTRKSGLKIDKQVGNLAQKVSQDNLIVNAKNQKDFINGGPKVAASKEFVSVDKPQPVTTSVNIPDAKIEKNIPKVDSNSAIGDARWQSFLKNIESINDPLVISIFKQGIVTKIDEAGAEIFISFSEKLLFFKDWLDSTKVLWHPILESAFGKKFNLIISFIAVDKGSASQPQVVNNSSVVKTQTQAQPVSKSSYSQSRPNNFGQLQEKKTETVVSVEDKEKWKKANLLLKIFPGKITDSK